MTPTSNDLKFQETLGSSEGLLIFAQGNYNQYVLKISDVCLYVLKIVRGHVDSQKSNI